MGLTFLELEVANPARPDVREKLEFLIDSGAIYSVLPAAVLDRLGIEPVAEQEFRLANGSKIRRRRGVALFRLGDRVGGSDVIFGEPGDSVLLGVLTLESLGYVLDPIRRKLEPLPMILEAGDIFHTYSCYARGGDILLGTYNYLDLTPKGRNETGPNHNLTDWVRHHDRYDDGSADPTGRYRPEGSDASCDACEDRPEVGRAQ